MAIDIKEWARMHPYTAMLGGAVLLIIIGGSFVALRIQGTTTRPPRVWGGGGAPLINPSSYTPNAVLEAQNIFTNATDTPIGLYTSGQVSETGVGSGDTFDYEALLSIISGTPTKQDPKTTSDDLSLAYSFIPRGLLSAPPPKEERSPTQQRIYEYGNTVGSSIQSYEVLHTNDPQKLRDQAEDRQNIEKAETVRAIGHSMRSLGESLARMEDVPTEMKTNHEKLAQSYIEIGKNLAKVPDAQGDQAFLAAIEAYNASVEIFIQRFVAVATAFSAYGVTFDQSEPGSAFVFTNTNSL